MVKISDEVTFKVEGYFRLGITINREISCIAIRPLQRSSTYLGGRADRILDGREDGREKVVEGGGIYMIVASCCM